MKAFLLATLLLNASYALALDAEIAFSKGGRSDTLHLSDQNLTSAEVYATNRNGVLLDPEIFPGGGKIAFIDSGVLKVLSYQPKGNGIEVTGVQDLASGTKGNIEYLDISPDGSRIAYSAYSSTARDIVIISNTGSVLSKIPVSVWAANVTWTSNDSLVYTDYDKAAVDPATGLAGVYSVRKLQLDSNNAQVSDVEIVSSLTQPFGAIYNVSAAKSRPTLLLSVWYKDGSGHQIVEFDMTALSTKKLTAGEQACYSSNDSEVLYKQSSGGRGYDLKKYNVASGSSERLNRKPTGYEYLEWRP